MNKGPISAAILFLALAAPTPLPCQTATGAADRPQVIPPTMTAELRRLLPDPTPLSIQPRGEPRFYGANLFQYIDGAADAYLDFGLVAMLHQEYKSSGVDITLDIYNLGSAENAFGIYAAERAPNYHFFQLGTEAYGSDEILNFLQGKFYVKLSAFSETQKTAPLLERLARAVSQRMGLPTPMPAFVALFPPDNLMSHSIKYVKKAPLGHEFLSPALTASYSSGAKPTVLVISKAANPQAALRRLEQVRSYFASSGKLAPAADVAPGAFQGLNPDDGGALFLASGSYVIVCLEPPSDPQPLIKSVIERVRAKGGTISF
jgi:hypothetical protein